MSDIDDNQAGASAADQKAEIDSYMVQAGILPPPATETSTEGATATGGSVTTATPPPVFSFDTLKTKFGYETPEALITDVEQLRALKANPPVATVEFENEDSKRLFEAWRGGKTKEVYQFLDQQEKLNNLLTLEVNKDTAAEIVKFGMQQKYKDLTPSEIDYKFKKQFSVPPKPVQSSDMEDDEYKAKLDSWQEIVNDRQMELMIEAKLARPELEQSKAKLIFPEIEQQSDQELIDYKKAVEENSRLAADAVRVYKTFTPEAVATKFSLIDKTNGIALDSQYIPDAESFGKTMEMVTDIEKFYDQFQNPDGSPDRNKFFKTIHNALNMDRIISDAMTQAKNATLRALLPDNSQSTGLVRSLNLPVEPTEVDEGMARAGIKRGG